MSKNTESLALRVIWKLPHAVPFLAVIASWIAAAQIAGSEPHEFGLLPPVALWFLGLLLPAAFVLALFTAAIAFFSEWLVNTRRLNQERRGGQPGK